MLVRLFRALVEIEGFEPSLTEPESVVLPLHHISMSIPQKRIANVLQFLIIAKILFTNRKLSWRFFQNRIQYSEERQNILHSSTIILYIWGVKQAIETVPTPIFSGPPLPESVWQDILKTLLDVCLPTSNFAIWNLQEETATERPLLMTFQSPRAGVGVLAYHLDVGILRCLSL